MNAAAKPPIRVMIVDDAVMMRTVTRLLLTEAGDFTVVAACANGQVALAELAKAQPELILLDIEMPEMDGLTFLRHARLKTRAKICVFSAVAETESPRALEARKLGADAVVKKPSGSVSLDLRQKGGDELLKTLRALVRR